MVILGIIGYRKQNRETMQQQLGNKMGEPEYLAHLAKIERMRLHLETKRFDTLKRIAPSISIGIFLVLALLSYVFLILYPPFLVFQILLFSLSFFILTSLSIYFIKFIFYLYISYNISHESKKLISHSDMYSISLFLALTQSFYISTNSKKPFYIALSPLLYEVRSDNPQKDSVVFSTEDQERLRKLAQNRITARRYPDTVAGALVALRTLGGPLNRVALLNIAGRKPKDKSEEWLPQSAQACLEDWNQDS
jgi:hypothetical protein